MDVVIVASGEGIRLGANKQLPKGRIKIHNEEIMRHNLNLLKKHTPINKVIVVTNKMFMQSFTEFMQTIDLPSKIVLNDNVSKGNGYSLHLAKDHVSTPEFILMMSDHYFSESFLSSAAVGKGLIVDRKPIYVDMEDATRVKHSKGMITNIGKLIDDFDSVDTGFFILSKDVFKHSKSVDISKASYGISDIIRVSNVPVTEVTGQLWIDVDTFLDLEKAKELIPKE